MLRRYVRDAHLYLEFGMGGSTFDVLTASRAVIYSVESSPDWAARMHRYGVIRRAEGTRLRTILVDIGRTKEWGFPVDEDATARFPAYSRAVYRVPSIRRLDVALIDGRFRVACALAIAEATQLSSKVVYLVHDFTVRPSYHVLLRFFDIADVRRTLVALKLKRGLVMEDVRACWEQYATIPD